MPAPAIALQPTRGTETEDASSGLQSVPCQPCLTGATSVKESSDHLLPTASVRPIRQRTAVRLHATEFRAPHQISKAGGVHLLHHAAPV